MESLFLFFFIFPLFIAVKTLRKGVIAALFWISFAWVKARIS